MHYIYSTTIYMCIPYAELRAVRIRLFDILVKPVVSYGDETRKINVQDNWYVPIPVQPKDSLDIFWPISDNNIMK